MSVLDYLNFWIYKSLLGFSIDQTYNIIDLLNWWFPYEYLRKFDTPFWTEYTHEKEIMDQIIFAGNELQKSEREYHGNFGHTIGWIQHIDITITIEICYTYFHPRTKTVAPTLPYFQGLKRCIKYIATHPHKPIFYT